MSKKKHSIKVEHKHAIPATTTPVKPYKKKLFCYGTLNIHDIQEWLWGESMSGLPMTLLDYELNRYSNNILYVTKKFGETVAGKMYELTDEQLEKTDAYEGAAYKRVSALVDNEPLYVYVQNKEMYDEEAGTDSKTD